MKGMVRYSMKIFRWFDKIGKPKAELNPQNRLPLYPKMEAEYNWLKCNIFKDSRSVKTLLLTSSIGNEGTSRVLVNLALTLARNTEKRVLLIDGNLRHPTLHKTFCIEKTGGLAEIVEEGIDYGGSLKRSKLLPNLLIMTSGRDCLNPVPLFEGERFMKLLDQLRGSFDTVLMDSPPINVFPDPVLIAPRMDGVLIVIEAERTRRSVVKEAISKVQGVKGHVLGVVLNKRKYYIPESIYRRL
jgi:capsular exopolysaccharide synthesis family protein